MLRRLPPSALALALGTPAYGMVAVGGVLPEPPLPPAPSSMPTPHIPMRAIAPPPPTSAAPIPADGLPTDSVRADSLRADSLRAGPPPAATPAKTAAPAARILGAAVRGRAAARVRVEVSRAERTLTVLQGDDTLLVAPASVGSGDTLRYGARTWRFATPPGRRVVQGKQAAPVWVPPEWHYAELAKTKGWTLRHLRADRAVRLDDGRRLVVRGNRVGVVDADGFEALPTDEEIVFDGTLYVPPLGTANRRVPGQLGAYRLDLGDGYLIHGTPNESTVGVAGSHGCVRLAGDALAWVFANVPVGATVTIR